MALVIIYPTCSAYEILNIMPSRVDSWPGQPTPPTYPPSNPGYPIPPSNPGIPIPPSNPGYPGHGNYQSAQQLFNTGQTYFNQGNFYSAIQTLRRLLDVYPYDYHAAEACFMTAESYRRLNDFANAERFYRKVTTSYTTFMNLDRAAYFIGFCQIKQNNYYGAINELRNFVMRFTTSQLVDDAWYILGRTYETINNIANAINAYQTVVNSYPYSEYYTKARDRLRVLQGNGYPEQPPTYPPANPGYPIPPTYPGTPTQPSLSDQEMYNRGHTQLSLGNYSNAITYFEELRKQYPNSYYADDALLWIAKTRYQQKNYVEAIRQFENFRRYYPSSEIYYDALFGLAYAEYKLALTNASYRNYFSMSAGHFVLFQQTYPSHKWSAEAFYQSGDCYERLGDYTTAKYYYQQVVDLYPNSPSAIKAKQKLGYKMW